MFRRLNQFVQCLRKKWADLKFSHLYVIVCTLFAIRMLNKHSRPQMASLFRPTLWLSRMWQVAHCEVVLKSLLFLFLCFAYVYNFYFLSAQNTLGMCPVSLLSFHTYKYILSLYIWSTQKDLWHLWANKKTRELHEIIKHTINLYPAMLPPTMAHGHSGLSCSGLFGQIYNRFALSAGWSGWAVCLRRQQIIAQHKYAKCFWYALLLRHSSF